MEKKEYYLFIDESGNHGLTEVNTDFPVFLLCGVIFEKIHYKETFVKNTEQLKIDFWGTKDVIFHSRDIRKCQHEFQILFDMGVKGSFYNRLNALTKESEYHIIASAIDKENFIKKYGKLSQDVYELCLSFIVERAIFYLDTLNTPIRLHIIIEERGKNEDAKLKEHFQRIKARGTGYVSAQRIQNYETIIAFRKKNQNVCGLQLADLIAYPTARYVIDKQRANPAFDVFKDKFYKNKAGDKIYGLKIHP